MLHSALIRKLSQSIAAAFGHSQPKAGPPFAVNLNATGPPGLILEGTREVDLHTGDGDVHVVERLEVYEISPGRFRIVTPTNISEEALDFGDMIEATVGPYGELLNPRILEKGAFLKYENILPTRMTESEQLRALMRAIHAEGGYAETVMGGIFRAYQVSTTKIDLLRELDRIAEEVGAV